MAYNPMRVRHTVKPVLSGHSTRRPKLVFKTDYCLMQVKRIAEHSAILLNFIKLPFVIKIIVLSIFETGLTVYEDLFIIKSKAKSKVILQTNTHGLNKAAFKIMLLLF